MVEGKQIILLLYYSKYVLNAEEIRDVVGIPLEEVKELLLILQDADVVFLRNGFYTLSKVAENEVGEFRNAT